MAEMGGIVQRVRTLIQSVGEIGKDLVTSGSGGIGVGSQVIWGRVCASMARYTHSHRTAP